MASTVNSFQWRRKGNSQIRNHSTTLIDTPTDSFKLPALHAINKSIKYNDISFATSRDLNKLRKQPEQVDNIEELSAHHNLMVIRKKYDNMNKTREQIQKEVDDMEVKKNKFVAEKNRFEDEKSKGSSKVEELNQNLNNIKYHLEESEIQKKVMLNMMDRIKSDKIVYDLRKYKLEKELTYIEKQKQIILKENAGKIEEEDKTRKIYQKLVDHLQAEKQQREAHLNSMTGMINQRLTVNENSELRKSQMLEIAQNTLQDKDPKQKNWYKVYLCSVFVSRLLRDKMTREMTKFNTVQVAFKNIKTQTGVSNTSDLVKKFLNKETAYGDLLGKIAENERHIVELKNENEQLVKERRNLKIQKDVLSSNRVERKGTEKEEKELHQMQQKSTHCQLMVEQLRLWGAKNMKKFNSMDNISQEVIIKTEYKDIVEQLKIYLKRMSDSINEAKQINEAQTDSTVSLDSKNIRIKLNSQEQPAQTKKTEHQVDQSDFMNYQRSEMIKNNDKFMKDVKKKYQDLKKQQIEAQPKKRQVVVQKPKPQPIES